MPIQKLAHDDKMPSIGFMISGLSSTRINNKTLYVLQNPLQTADTRLILSDFPSTTKIFHDEMDDPFVVLLIWHM